MKDIDTNRLENASISKKSDGMVPDYKDSSTGNYEGISPLDFVPLLPTETGRKRHDAHQLKAPRFLHNAIECQQSQYTEMYLG